MQAQRVLAEAQRVMTNKHQWQALTPTNITELKTEEITNHNITRDRQAPMISQDHKNNDDNVRPLSAIMQQQHQTLTLTQEYMLHMMELLGRISPFTP